MPTSDLGRSVPSRTTAPGTPDVSARVAGRTMRRRALALASGALLAASALAGCTPSPSADASAPTTPPGGTPSESPGQPSTEGSAAVPMLADQSLDELEPGQYALTVADGPSHRHLLVVTVPAGYRSVDREGFGVVSTGDLTDVDARVLWTWELEEIYSHPCDAGAVLQPVGPAIADIAAALAAQPMRAGTVPQPVTVGGHDGYYIELTVPDGIDVDACPTGRFNSWPGRWMQEAGQLSMVWILDVDGEQVTIEASHGPSADPVKAAELRAMVETATFVGRDDR